MQAPAVIPLWEKHFPGLMAWELARLQEVGRSVEVVEKELAKGLLVVRFEWPFLDGYIPLEATFPASYPYTRPHVRLLSPREEWPERHVGPIDGAICLLGRDTGQWTPDYYLAKLLLDQLENALTDEGAQDPQAEPADFWWNGIALANSYCLIDSSWSLGTARHGKLEVAYLLEDSRPPVIRGYVKRIVGSDNALLAEWTAPLPDELANARARISVSWHLSEQAILPRPPIFTQILSLREKHFGGVGNPTKIAGDLSIRPFVFFHPIEHLGGNTALGGIFGLDWGASRSYSKKGPKEGRGISLSFLRVLRAGTADLRARVPDAEAMRGKRITVVGVGAIGAPIAIELARNGARELRIVDHDIVEPGNSERWPLGASNWGRKKTEAIAGHIESQFPGVQVVPIDYQFGAWTDDDSDDSIADRCIADIDLVIDAAVSSGISYFLWDRCMRAGIPLIKVGATPTLGGGTVLRHVPDSGCPICLQHAREDGCAKKPPGSDEMPVGIQPPGCGERTFTGAAYDLQELSLQTVRLAVDTFRTDAASGVVQTLFLKDANGERILPHWEEQSLDKHAKCCGKPSP